MESLDGPPNPPPPAKPSLAHCSSRTPPIHSQEEDTINTEKDQARLKDIPVPISIAQTRVEGTDCFELPKEHIKAPPPTTQWPTSTGVYEADDPVDWDIDPAGNRFLKLLNKGEKGYAGPPLEEALFEKIIDRFEKAVKDGVMPELSGLQANLSPLVADASVIDVAYAWWLERRKFLAMPLIRKFRPAPDPEDPDTTGVAFRPREKEGVRRLRSNNKKTYNLMASLHDEFTRLKSLCDLVKRRERLKMEFHQASGEYVEAAHRTLLHRLHRQRTGQGGWKDDLEDEGTRPAVSHKKGASSGAMGGGSGAMAPRPGAVAVGGLRPGSNDPRSHHKKRQPGPGRPPKDGVPPGPPSAGAPRPRDRDRDRDRDRHRRQSAPPPLPSSYLGLYLRPSDGSDQLPSYEDVDSEEEAFNQMVLTVDTAKRDELAALLPRHLRDIKPPDDDDAPVPYSDAAGAAAALDGVLNDVLAASSGRGFGVIGGGLGMSLGAAAEAAAAVGSSSSSSAPAAAAPAPAPAVAASAAPAAAGGAGAAAAASSSAAAPAPPPLSGPIGGLASSYVFPSRVATTLDDERRARTQPPTVVARLRIGRGGRVLIDRGRGLGGGPRYARTCWHTVDAAPSSSGSGGGSAGAGAGTDASAGAGGSADRPRVSWSDGGASGEGGARPPRPSLSAAAVAAMLQSGRACPPAMLDEGLDPDAAWRRNEPVPIKRGPLLFDFSWLPKPQLVPSANGPSDAEGGAVVGQKRKAADLEHPSTNGVM